jgi:hypothetical protein
MVNKYPFCGYQIVNATRQLAAVRQVFSGKSGNNFDLSLIRAHRAHDTPA